MVIFDVIVIGGGPSGASAAKEAVERGLTVALFDHTHPRRKACGGGLPVKGIEWMDAPDDAIECHVSSISFKHEDIKLKIPVNKGKYVRRDVWDNYLFNRAKEAGAEVFKERVVKIEKDDNLWKINDTHHSKYIIGADGVNGISRKTFSNKISRDNLFSAFGYYLGIKPEEDEMEFIVGHLPGEEGYIWVFPKKDHYNVGICYNARTPGMRDALDSYVKNRWPGEKIDGKKWKLNETGEEVDYTPFGSAIPSYNSKKLFDEPISGPDWVLCGDAAGHVNPIHGEGLNHAVLGGRLAAQAVSEGDPTKFESYWREHYREDMYHAVTVKHQIYRSWFLRLAFKLGRTPSLFHLLSSIVRDEDRQSMSVIKFWFKLPIACMQALFGITHPSLKSNT